MSAPMVLWSSDIRKQSGHSVCLFFKTKITHPNNVLKKKYVPPATPYLRSLLVIGLRLTQRCIILELLKSSTYTAVECADNGGHLGRVCLTVCLQGSDQKLSALGA